MTQRTSWLATLLVATLLLALPGAVKAQPTAGRAAGADLPITRLALFTSGVGYFEHEGLVVDDQELVLQVPKREMDDLLQSLVLQDFGGGVVEAVRYSSHAPLTRLLGGYSLDLSGAPTLLELLAQARGELVRLDGPAVIEGALLGVEEEPAGEGLTRAFITVSTASGVRRVALDELSAVRFLDEEVAAELDAALATIRANRNDDVATVTLRFTGEGERPVRVGYVREMPLWKSTYRLVVGEDGRGSLQGWAIVDNPTDEALEDVRLSFVAGQPASFVTSLYDPVWAERPRVEVEATGGIVPQLDVGVAPSAPAMAREAAFDLAMPAPTLAAPDLSGAGVAGQAAGAATATSFAYHVEQPVTIGRNESALVPVVVTEVTAERVSLFDDVNHPSHPLHAVRLQNDTGLQLGAGTVTIYDAAGFAGNALMPDLLPGEERLLAYAVDLDLRVEVGTGPRTTEVTRLSLRGGVAELVELTRLTLNVAVTGSVEEGRFLVVQGPPMPGFEVVAPQPAPRTAETRPRFGIAIVGESGTVPDGPSPTHLVCRPGSDCLLEVVAERVDGRTVSLSSVSEGTLLHYLENAELSADDRALIEQVVDVQERLAEAERAATRTEAAIEVIFAEQQRIRSNMSALDRNSDLYRRYVSELTEQEDDLAALRRQQETQLTERDDLQRRLRELLGGAMR